MRQLPDDRAVSVQRRILKTQVSIASLLDLLNIMILLGFCRQVSRILLA